MKFRRLLKSVVVTFELLSKILFLILIVGKARGDIFSGTYSNLFISVSIHSYFNIRSIFLSSRISSPRPKKKTNKKQIVHKKII